MRTLDDHRSEYTATEASRRLQRDVEKPMYRPIHQQRAVHVHRYSSLNFMCRCGKHGRAW